MKSTFTILTFLWNIAALIVIYQCRYPPQCLTNARNHFIQAVLTLTKVQENVENSPKPLPSYWALSRSTVWLMIASLDPCWRPCRPLILFANSICSNSPSNRWRYLRRRISYINQDYSHCTANISKPKTVPFMNITSYNSMFAWE